MKVIFIGTFSLHAQKAAIAWKRAVHRIYCTIIRNIPNKLFWQKNLYEKELK